MHEELTAWLQAQGDTCVEDAAESERNAACECERASDANPERAAASDPGRAPGPGHGAAPSVHGASSAAEHGTSAADPTFRIEHIFREGVAETTQLVWFRGASGSELGPFVRKVIRAGSGIGTAYETLAEAQREGKRLRHVPRVYSCTHEAASLVVLLEYIPGATLREVIAGVDPSQRQMLAARLMPALCDAVSELHEAFDQPLIHRDLTPGNVVCPEGDPVCLVLIDLGIARTWSEHATVDTTHFGTRAYAPPEQFGFGQTDVRSDVYALGLLAFFCLTGRDPEPADRECGFAAPGVSKAWREVIAKAAEYDPRRRYASAGELRAACLAAGDVPERARRWDEDASGEPGVSAETGEDVSPEPESAAIRPSSGGVLSLRQAVLAAASRIPHGVGRVWNVLVLLSAGALVAASFSMGASVGQRPSINSPVVDLFGYLVYVPVLFLATGYALLDRRRLRRRFSALARRSILREWGLCALVILALTVLLVILIALGG